MLSISLLKILAGPGDVVRGVYIVANTASNHPEETGKFLAFVVFIFIAGVICAIVAGIATSVIKASLSLEKEDAQKCFYGIGGGLLFLAAIGYLIR